MSAERLQKVLASAGVASRRDCEALIAAGRVTVNGRVIQEPGTRVDLTQDSVLLDGKPVQQPVERTYLMLHKPVGFVSTADDPQGRPTVVELVDVPARVFPIGRLDVDSEGLILLTDDGDMTHRLTHPRFAVEKEYRALLDRPLDAEALRMWRVGVDLNGEPTAPAWVEQQEQADEGAWARIVLREGRKRQIREVARQLGYNVLRLIRVREGNLSLGDLPARQWRPLTAEEVEVLRTHAASVPLDERPGSGESREPRAERRPADTTAERPARREPPRERGSYPARTPNERPLPKHYRLDDDDETPEQLGEERPASERPRDDRPRDERAPRSYSERPRDDRPRDDRAPRSYSDRPRDDRPAPRYGERSDRPRDDRPRDERPAPRYGERPRDDRAPRSSSDRPAPRYGERSDRPRDDRPRDDRAPRSYGPPRDSDNRGREGEPDKSPNDRPSSGPRRSEGDTRGERPGRGGRDGFPFRKTSDSSGGGSASRRDGPARGGRDGFPFRKKK